VVCDDDLMSRRVVCGLLADAGFDIVGEADMALHALEIVSAARPDLLVLDVNLPGLPGDEIVRDVRERSPETKVIVISAFDLEHLDRAEMDVDAVLPKSDLVRFDEVLAGVMASR
jgi:YesN/AraC family two-component response regulator